MESSMYWLDLIAETYIGICVLCCLFIISKQRRRPAPMMRVMLLVWPIITLWAGPLGIWAYETSNRRDAHLPTWQAPSSFAWRPSFSLAVHCMENGRWIMCWP